MNNLEALDLAVQLMRAHNQTCKTVNTFEDIKLNGPEERITFRCEFQFIGTVDKICDLLNLSFGINKHEPLTFYIR